MAAGHYRLYVIFPGCSVSIPEGGGLMDIRVSFGKAVTFIRENIKILLACCSFFVLLGLFLYFFYRPARVMISGLSNRYISAIRCIAGVKEIQCRFCHPYVERSGFPGIPPVEKCLYCHDYIIANHPEIKKEHQYYNTQTPVPWGEGELCAGACDVQPSAAYQKRYRLRCLPWRYRRHGPDQRTFDLKWNFALYVIARKMPIWTAGWRVTIRRENLGDFERQKILTYPTAAGFAVTSAVWMAVAAFCRASGGHGAHCPGPDGGLRLVGLWQNTAHPCESGDIRILWGRGLFSAAFYILPRLLRTCLYSEKLGAWTCGRLEHRPYRHHRQSFHGIYPGSGICGDGVAGGCFDCCRALDDIYQYGADGSTTGGSPFYMFRYGIFWPPSF